MFNIIAFTYKIVIIELKNQEKTEKIDNKFKNFEIFVLFRFLVLMKISEKEFKNNGIFSFDT